MYARYVNVRSSCVAHSKHNHRSRSLEQGFGFARFASQPIESADTVKSFDQLAKELMEEKNRGDEVSDPDSIIALKLKEHYAPTVCLPQPIRHVCAELPTRSR